MASHSVACFFRKESLASELLPDTGDTYAFLRNTKFGIDTYCGIDSIAQH